MAETASEAKNISSFVFLSLKKKEGFKGLGDRDLTDTINIEFS